jgi:hypothetical protein
MLIEAALVAVFAVLISPYNQMVFEPLRLGIIIVLGIVAGCAASFLLMWLYFAPVQAICWVIGQLLLRPPRKNC